MQSVPITTKVEFEPCSCQWLVTGRWFFRGTLMSSTNAADGYDITEILLKVMLRPINLNLFPYLALEIKTSLWVPLLEQYFLFISEHQTVIKNCVRFLILSNQKMVFSKYKILIGLFIVCFIYEYKNNTQKFYAWNTELPPIFWQ
jgi:hypothetical protein